MDYKCRIIHIMFDRINENPSEVILWINQNEPKKYKKKTKKNMGLENCITGTMLMGHVTWQPMLGLLSWYLVM